MIETLKSEYGVLTGWTALVPGEDGKPVGITLYRKEVAVAGPTERLVRRSTSTSRRRRWRLSATKDIPGRRRRRRRPALGDARKQGGLAQGPRVVGSCST